MKKILIVLMCILLSGVAHAGPFGTSEGDGLDRYPGAESLGDNTYVVYSLPKYILTHHSRKIRFSKNSGSIKNDR